MSKLRRQCHFSDGQPVRVCRLSLGSEGYDHFPSAVGNSNARRDARGFCFDGASPTVRVSFRGMARSNPRWLGGVSICPHRKSTDSWYEIPGASTALIALADADLTIGSSDRGNYVFGEPRRDSMIVIKQLRFLAPQPRVAQPHR
jgi:hypothetical protein